MNDTIHENVSEVIKNKYSEISHEFSGLESKKVLSMKFFFRIFESHWPIEMILIHGATPSEPSD
jgi:hypothetical protein